MYIIYYKKFLSAVFIIFFKTISFNQPRDNAAPRRRALARISTPGFHAAMFSSWFICGISLDGLSAKGRSPPCLSHYAKVFCDDIEVFPADSARKIKLQVCNNAPEIRTLQQTAQNSSQKENGFRFFSFLHVYRSGGSQDKKHVKKERVQYKGILTEQA